MDLEMTNVFILLNDHERVQYTKHIYTYFNLMILAMSPVDVLRSEKNEKMNYSFKHLCRKNKIYNN